MHLDVLDASRVVQGVGWRVGESCLNGWWVGGWTIWGDIFCFPFLKVGLG